jgi:hypothetical protein
MGRDVPESEDAYKLQNHSSVPADSWKTLAICHWLLAISVACVRRRVRSRLAYLQPMNPWEKSTKLEGVESRGANVTPEREGQPPAAPSPTLPSSSVASPGGASGEPATKEVVQTQASRLAAEARRLSGELEHIAEWFQRDLVAEAARLAQLDKELSEREAAVQHNEKLHREGAELKRNAEAQAQEIQCKLGEAQSRKAAAEKAEQSALEAITHAEQAAATARAEQQRAKALLADCQAERDKAEAVRNEAARSQQEAQRLLDEAEKLQGLLLPKAFQSEIWRAWREEVIRRATADGPVSLLVARLHTATALERSGRPLTMELVRDIGRSVYETYSAQGERIAQALTQAARGQFDIKTVRVGDRVDNKFMKPSASGLVEVRTVMGWAVRDAKGSWQFLAEVS